jgi:hypothetical protein
VNAEWAYRRETEPPDPVSATATSLDDEDRALLAELVRAGYRALSLKYHPDVGGDPETMLRLNRLVAMLRERLAA